jgi:hypothetical protein
MQLTTRNMLANSALVRCRVIFGLISQPLQIYAFKTENNLVYKLHLKYRHEEPPFFYCSTALVDLDLLIVVVSR